MHYVPHTDSDIKALLNDLGKTSIDELFESVPQSVQFKSLPSIGEPLPESSVHAKVAALAKKNMTASSGNAVLSFLGAGVYSHYVPACVGAISSRGEFLTSYTPYQAEISQGNLQAGFEFQSLVASLLKMDVANASMYDGANAFVEAVFMARRIKKQGKIWISRAIHPQYLETLATYADGIFEFEWLEIDSATGQTDFSPLEKEEHVLMVACQSPNFFGVIEPLESVVECKKDGLFVQVANELHAFGAIKAPGEFDVDIVACEGQSLGNGAQFGGPHLGIIAAKKSFIRQLPGRLVGRTEDVSGQTAYVLTLSTREQHIRREKATSNICTNQFLLALRCAVYLAWLGKSGLRDLAFRNAKNMAYLLKKIEESARLECLFTSHSFHEVAVKLPGDVQATLAAGAKRGVIAGLALDEYGFDDALLIRVSSSHKTTDVDALVEILNT